jgi:UDP-glucuronate decarboxylase
VTVRDLASRIIRLTRSSSRIVRRPMPLDDPTRRCPDIGLAIAALGWQPRTSLEDGLKKTAAWFEQVLADVEIEPLMELGGGRA